MSLSFFRFNGPLTRLWAFAQMGFARLPLSRIDGLGFWKLLGSGSGEGFTPLPDTSVYAILCTWPDLETATRSLREGRVFQRYRSKSDESWTVFLNPITSRGNWSGTSPFEPTDAHSQGPLVALTRATIKPSILLKFWKRVPQISDVIGNDPNVLFKIGIGEVPLLHQVTFSIWPDEGAMANFARTSGPHARAIKAVRSENWFREELYARFHVVGQTGSWMGQNPLPDLNLEPVS